MEREVDKVYKKAVKELKKRKDFNAIDLDMVQNYALAMVMFRDFEDDDLGPQLLQVKHYGNQIAEILNLPMIGPTDSADHKDPLSAS